MEKALQRNIKLLLLFTGLHWFLPVMPVIVIFMQSTGISLGDVLLLQSIFAVTLAACEIPSGYIADLIGRKASLVWACFFNFSGIACLAMANSWGAFAVSEFLIGVGCSLISGADSALLFDTLLVLKREGEYTHIEGKKQMVASFSEASAAVVGGLVAVYSLRYPVYIELFTQACCLLIALSLFEPERAKLDVSNGRIRKMLDIVLHSMVHNKVLKYWIVHVAGMGLISFVLVWLVQPYLKELSVPLSWFGVVWAILNALVGFAAPYASRLEKRFPAKTILLCLTLVSAASCVMVGLVPGFLGMLFVSIVFVCRGIRGPITQMCINKQTSSDQRATVLSINSMAFRLGYVMVAPIFGYVADNWSLSYCFIVCGIGFAAFSLLTHLCLKEAEAGVGSSASLKSV